MEALVGSELLIDELALAEHLACESAKPKRLAEWEIERHLCRLVRAAGGLCEKFVSPLRQGVPDRLITWPDGRMQLVELKTSRGIVRRAQLLDHAMRAKRACSSRCFAAPRTSSAGLKITARWRDLL